METDAALQTHWRGKLHKCVPPLKTLFSAASADRPPFSSSSSPLDLPLLLAFPVRSSCCPSLLVSAPLAFSLPPSCNSTLSATRRRVKTLEKPAHTPEESVAATGQSKPDNVQRGTETIQKWSASHSTVVKGEEQKAMDVEA